MTDQLLTPEEVAARLRVHVATIYNYLNSGKLRGFKAGPRNWRIYESDVDAFLQANQNLVNQDRASGS